MKCGMTVLAAAFLVTGTPLYAASFGTPELVTDGAAAYQLSRNAGGNVVFDAAGTLHLAYWSGSGSAVSPSNPSRVYYRGWTRGGGWSAQVDIDNSEIGGEHIGGRQPSIAVDTRGDVWVVWHDHRHSTQTSSYVDNVEIYADRKPAGGSFSETDRRLTTSNAGDAGDNGYAPQITALSDGRLAVSWYDFFGDDVADAEDVSDIYMKISDTDGDFDPMETMEEMRLTNLNARGGIPAFALPDVEAAASDDLYIVWMTTLGISGDLHFSRVGSGAITDLHVISGVSSFFDPPKLVRAEDGFWIVYSSSPGPNRNVHAARVYTEPGFSIEDYSIDPRPGNQSFPTGAVDSLGRLHLAWIDESEGRAVYHGLFDPASETLVERQVVSPGGSIQRTSIAVGPDDEPVIVYEELIDVNTGRIWFAGPPPTAANDAWRLYP